MLKNYIKIALRNILRDKVTSFINIFGLAASMAAAIIMLSFIYFEFSYDKFHTKSEDIYRVTTSVYNGGIKEIEVPKTLAGVGPALKDRYDQVYDFTRMWPFVGKVNMSYKDITYNETRLFFADSTFFNVFDFALVEGDRLHALSPPNTVVLTEEMAAKYFRDEDPIGKIIELQDAGLKLALKVTGISRDIPENSHIKYDFLVSQQTLIDLRGRDNWENAKWATAQFFTYLWLDKNMDQTSMEPMLASVTADFIDWSPREVKLSLQPMLDIHLHSNLVQEMEANGDYNIIVALMLIVTFILIIGWINYVNLATAKTAARAKEVGLRKSIGAIKSQLVGQFMFESVLINLISFVIAILIVLLIAPWFESLIGRPFLDLVLEYPGLWLLLGGFVVLGSISASIYPSFILSSLDIVKSLKGNTLKASRKKFSLREGLVVVQIFASLFLIVATITVARQMNFLKNKDLGMDINNIMVFTYPDVIDTSFVNKANYFKNEITKHSAIDYFSFSSSVPGDSKIIISGGLRDKTESPDVARSFLLTGIDDDFINVFGMTLIAGRNFSKDFGTDVNNVIINEELVRAMGYQDPESALGRELVGIFPPGSNRTGKIIGVMKNFHQKSLKSEVDPMVFMYDPMGGGGFLSLKFNDQVADLGSVVGHAKSVWNSVFAGNPFDYFYHDSYYNTHYKSDEQFRSVLGFFTILAIILSCMGLFGISYLTMTLKLKEISIRKVLGARPMEILYLLIKGYIGITIISALIGIPLAYYFLNGWLDNFPFRIDVGWWVPLLSIIIMIAIILSTVIYQTLKALSVNPAITLRNE